MTQLDILISEDRIQARMARMAVEIAAALPASARTEGVLLVGPLKGCLMVIADLARALHKVGLPVEIDFMTLSSYGAGTESSGTVRVVAGLTMDVAGRHVVLVDDIADTGRTLALARELVDAGGPATVRVAVALDKPSRRVVPVQIDHVGFEVPDLFVLGYGADLDQRYRELPYIGVYGG